MNTNSKTRRLTQYALFIAIIAIMSAVPFLGFIQVSVLAVTIVHIPVIIGAILYGPKAALLFGLAFGVSSLLVALTRGAASDLFFINPMISVVPRLIFAGLIPVIYQGLRKTKLQESAAVGLTAFLSSLIHSFLVLTALFILITLQGGGPINMNTVSKIFAAVISLNVLVEAFLSTIVTIPVVRALRNALNRE